MNRNQKIAARRARAKELKAQGLSNPRIAAILECSVSTVHYDTNEESRKYKNKVDAQYQKDNPDAHSFHQRNYCNKHRETVNKYVVKKMQRRAEALAALTEEQLAQRKAIYKLAQEMSERTNVLHEVDHHIPKHLGGGEEPANLWVINAVEHSKKTRAEARAR